MENIEKDVIRLEPGKYRRRPLPWQETLSLPKPLHSSLQFFEVLKRRRSAQSFPPITNASLSNFLYAVGSLQQAHLDDSNLQRRYVASMGALHPTHIVIHRPGTGWFAYIPEKHSLGILNVNKDSAVSVLQLVQQHYPSETATLICLVSDRELAANYYENYVPLLLRDAGVLLGHASLVAAAHDLAFRILGRTGAQATEALVTGLPFKPLASGMAMLGGPEFSAD
jgi:hypothetical protein